MMPGAASSGPVSSHPYTARRSWTWSGAFRARLRSRTRMLLPNCEGTINSRCSSDSRSGSRIADGLPAHDVPVAGRELHATRGTKEVPRVGIAVLPCFRHRGFRCRRAGIRNQLWVAATVQRKRMPAPRGSSSAKTSGADPFPHWWVRWTAARAPRVATCAASQLGAGCGTLRWLLVP